MENWFNDTANLLVANRPLLWATAVGAAVLMTVLIKIVFSLFTRSMRKLTQRTSSVWDDVGLDLIDGWKSIETPPVAQRLLLIAVVIFSVLQTGIWGLYLIQNWKKTYLDHRIKADPSAAAALGLLYTTIQGIFIVIVFLIGLSNLGVNIGALIAGLGVGGIAVALAAQNILGDLLASLSIVLDKPFIVGDFIVAGKEAGTVENVGIKTTRLRSISGEEIIVSNKDLLESRVQNFKHMWQRRIVQKFGVTYATPAEKLQQIPKWVQEFVQRHEKLKFDRCHFAAFGASSLDYEFVFIVSDPDYNVFMDLQQAVLMDILQKFASEGIEFAFPTQSVFVEKWPALNASPSESRPDPKVQNQNALPMT
jgi:small-conductance mechanosensitive channel